MGTYTFCLRGIHFSSPGSSTSISPWENHVSLISLVWERSGCDTTADFGVRHEPEAWPIGSPHLVMRLVPGGCPAQMGLTKISPKSWVPCCVLSHLTWAQARRRGSFKDVVKVILLPLQLLQDPPPDTAFECRQRSAPDAVHTQLQR